MDTIFARALEEVRPGMVIGLGSGRAAEAFLRGLGEKVSGGFTVKAVPTSEKTAAIARELGIPLVAMEDLDRPIDLTVDGADEVDPELNLIKGYGRALVREKIVAGFSLRQLILVGMEKLVNRLGDRGRLPVEVVPFALPLVKSRLKEMGVDFDLWQVKGKEGRTDNGNAILDCHTQGIEDLSEWVQKVRQIPGVVDTGLFLGTASAVLVGDENRGFAFCQLLERPVLDSN